MRILLVRHGETEWNRTKRFQGQVDIPLNDVGQEQAEALRVRLSNTPLSHVVSSDLSRARQTAETISMGRGLTLHCDPRWRELALGDLEGLYRDEVLAAHPKVIERWREAPQSVVMPGGESLEQLQTRVWEAYQDLPQLNADENILVVGHGFALISLLCRLLEVPLAKFRRFWLDHTGMSEIHRTAAQTVVRRINDTAHLEELSSSV